MEWTKFCTEKGILHKEIDHHKICPHCGAQNPSYKSISKPSQEIIEIEDSPQPKALTVSKQILQRFESYEQRPIAKLGRQTSAQNIQNSVSARSQKKRPQTKLESFRTNVTLWRRRYRILEEEDIRTDIQTECFSLRKTTIPPKNVNVASLDEFLYEHLLREIQIWNDFVQIQARQSGSSVYLATAAGGKDGPTRLPKSADELRTIKDILDFFPFSLNNKEWTIHIILEQEEARTDVNNILVPIKSEPKIKQEPKGRTKVKKEQIKKEQVKKEPKRLKRERPASYESPTAIRVKNQPISEPSIDCTDVGLESELEEEFPDFESLLAVQLLLLQVVRDSELEKKLILNNTFAVSDSALLILIVQKSL